MANEFQSYAECLKKSRCVKTPTENFKFGKRYQVNFATALILTAACRNISGFSLRQETLRSHSRISTARYFRNTGDDNVEGISPETDMTAAAFGLLNVPTFPAKHESSNDRTPIWLRHPEGSSAEQKLDAFRHAMDLSSLTPHEATIVETAILEAARGDLDKIAGAVDFCRILLETMEMGVSALVAASFHYCSCYDSTSLPSSKDEYTKLYLYPSEATSIVEDAAQLKRIEHDYASIDTMNSGDLRMLLLARTNNWNALAIRSAASLHRLRGIVRNCFDTKRETVGATEMRAARQALHIYAPLASQLGMHRLKHEIEGAAFQILYRRQYAALNARMCKPKKIVPGCRVGQDGELESFSCLRDDMNRILEQATAEVTRILSEDPSLAKHVNNMTITARVKESYSLWRKVMKLGAKSILDVPDALALRIVVNAKKMDKSEIEEITQCRDRLLCYWVQQTCSEHFKPVEGTRLKNYIANPKSNGYQSLHYATSTEYKNEKYPLEIQIRSREMHQVAEFGLASHWSYKFQTKSGKSSNLKEFHFDHSTAAYLRACGEMQWQHAQNNAGTRDPLQAIKPGSIDSKTNGSQEHITPFIEALEVTKYNLTRQRVYIFLASQQQTGTKLRKKGKLLELPAGACVLDALRESERTLGFSTSLRDQSLADIVHNDGALTSLTRKLMNGDILTIPASSRIRINTETLRP